MCFKRRFEGNQGGRITDGSRYIVPGRNFITLSVHLCLQHVCRDAPRRAGSSATADTCIAYINIVVSIRDFLNKLPAQSNFRNLSTLAGAMLC